MQFLFWLCFACLRHVSIMIIISLQTVRQYELEKTIPLLLCSVMLTTLNSVVGIIPILANMSAYMRFIYSAWQIGSLSYFLLFPSLAVYIGELCYYKQIFFTVLTVTFILCLEYFMIYVLIPLLMII